MNLGMKAKPPFTTTLLISTYNRPETLGPVLESALRQTILPMEIVIADDGSRNETRTLIEHSTKASPIPIVHVWHPDEGFRLSEIRNKAIAAAKGDYILQIDGDVLLERHFIADHVSMAEPGWFVCGSRVMLSQDMTEKIISSELVSLRLRETGIAFWLNGLRIGWLRRYMAKRYAKGEIKRLRGCNMAFWKKDMEAVNGYNEDLTDWGGEDVEIAYRLIHSGVQKKMLKMGGVEYHLYHTFAPKTAVERHINAIEQVKRERAVWCGNGLDKHLTH